MKRKSIKPPKFHDSVLDANEDENDALNAEDLEFFEDHQGFADFLLDGDYKQELSRSDIFNNNLKKRKKVDQDDLLDYEKQPRVMSKNSQKDEKTPRLLIKDSSGKWASASTDSAVRHEDDCSDSESEKDLLHKHSTDSDPITATNPTTGHQNVVDATTTRMSYHEKLEDIAHKASLVVENPQENVGKLKDIHRFASHRTEKDLRIIKLALMSLLAIYKDILPGYRVRKLSDKERAVKVSREIKALRQFEESLVTYYQSYLKTLEEVASFNADDTSLGVIAVKCMCEMISAGSHFNFASNLMNSIVTRMYSSKYGELCCKCVSKLFLDDETGHLSLELVKLMSQLAKKHLKSLKPRVIDCLLSLKLSADIKKKEVGRSRKDHSKHVSKRKKKENKVRDGVESELKEANAVVEYEEKLATQSETLKHLFVIYFRILKESKVGLLVSCLKGIQKFGHLISIDYFQNIIKVIKDTLETTKLAVPETLQCVNTCFSLYNIQQSLSVSLDLKDLYVHAYRSLRRINQSGGDIDMVVEMVELIFLRRSKTDIVAVRAAAFVKRLLALAVRLTDVENSVKVLQITRQLVSKSPLRVQQMLIQDEEEKPFSSGVFQVGNDNPDMCNAFAADFPEVAVLKSHKDTRIRTCISKWFQ